MAVTVADTEAAAAVAKPTATGRIEYLDGVRGWASLSVAVGHIVAMPLAGDLFAIRGLLVASLTNGALMVNLFFILSGDALSTQYWKRPGVRSAARQAIKRYPRLTLPIACACIVTVALTALTGNFIGAAGVAVANRSMPLLETHSTSLADLFTFSAFWVYVNPYRIAIIPFLWTMRTEMIGSFALFAFLFVAHVRPRLNPAILVVLTIASLAAGVFLSCFFFGALMSLLRIQGRLPTARGGAAGLSIVAAAVLCVLASTALWQHHLEYRQLDIPIAFLLYAMIPASRPLLAFATSRLALTLGRLSFPLYLVHYVVMATVSSRLIVELSMRDMLTLPAALAATVAGIAVSLLLAAAFQPIERGATALSNAVWRGAVRVAPRLSEKRMPAS